MNHFIQFRRMIPTSGFPDTVFRGHTEYLKDVITEDQWHAQSVDVRAHGRRQQRFER